MILWRGAATDLTHLRPLILIIPERAIGEEENGVSGPRDRGSVYKKKW